MDVVVKNCTMVSKIESLRESAKHSGSILASNPAALGSIFVIPKNLFLCC